MTAEDGIIEKSDSTAVFVGTEIEEIFEFLSLNDRIVFKSQQIDDPELERAEKIQIAREIFERNRQTFLQRFGVYMEEEHLNAFEQMAVTAIWTQHESGIEIQDMILDYRRRLQTHKRDVKNRRYTAMQQLIKQGDYFSELEMMNRAPQLYQELVGQYLSEEEIKQRDSYDVKNTTFSGILMHTFEQKQRDEMLKAVGVGIQNEANKCDNTEVRAIKMKQPDLEIEEEEEEEENGGNENAVVKRNNIESTEDDFEVPQTCRQQWGNFDNEKVACSTSRINDKPRSSNSLNRSKPKSLSSNVFITAGERALLRQEFVDIMHEQFLSGNDENFDYALVDENTQLDDLSQINQDKEDAYFAASDDEEPDNQQQRAPVIADDSDSEDELDLYMRHLNKHPSLKF